MIVPGRHLPQAALCLCGDARRPPASGRAGCSLPPPGWGGGQSWKDRGFYSLATKAGGRSYSSSGCALTHHGEHACPSPWRIGRAKPTPGGDGGGGRQSSQR